MPQARELNPGRRFLMGPGPSDVHPRVLKAMATPLVGHLDPEFIDIMEEVKCLLRQLFQTENEMTFPVSGTGSAGMEFCLVNLLEPGDTALICENGVFGQRMADIVTRCGATLAKVEAPWGKPIDPQKVREALERTKPKLVAVVHAETSTGVIQPLEEISRAAHDAGALFVVDTVTSLGGTEVCVDKWGIDAVYSATQKCLSAPPGLAPVSLSPRALQAIAKRKTRVQSWYLDVNLLRSYWEGEKRQYHHTAPISMIYALHEALRIIFEEGLPARFERHRRNHQLLRQKLGKLGFEFIVEEPYRLPMLNAVAIPPGLDDASVRRQLLAKYGIEIGAGLGQFAGKVWRIGLMGESSTPTHVALLASALREIMGV